jgi:hypothetical protein
MLAFSIIKADAQCFESICNGGPSIDNLTITYSVNHPNCGECVYTVNYKSCLVNGVSTFLINSISADPNNPTCCQGTAVNDPIVSGYILDEAARLISLTGTGAPDNQYNVYTPSRCWAWEGMLGPEGIHTAVLVPCGTNQSCCIYTYEVINGYADLIDIEQSGVQDCLNGDAPCFSICDP